MKKKIVPAIIFTVLLVLAILAYFKKPTQNQMLYGEWKFEAKYKNDSSEIKTHSVIYNFVEDFTFSRDEIYEDELFSKTGLWKIRDNVLMLTLDYDQEIDSLSYNVVENRPFVEFFTNGISVAQSSSAELTNRQNVERYEFETLTSEKLIFKHSAIDFTRVADDKLVASSGFQFNIMSIFRGIIGLTFIIGLSYLFSSNRKKVSWRVVGFGLLAQIILAFGILKIPAVAWVFETVGKIFVVILDFTREGSVFLLGDLLNADSFGFIFAFQVLPTIIFFSALTSLLFYLGIIQKVVYYMALVMTKLLRISGAESLSVAGNIFLGQTESPLMIKAYLDKMNRSEMLLVMSGGMATLAGGVLAAYIAFLGGTDPVQRLIFAKHLLAASVMAAPGVIVISKILIPQTESIDTDVVVSKEKIGSNVLDAISNGTSEGLKLAANVAAMLLTFIAMIALANFVLMKIGDVTGLNTLIHNLDPSYDGLSLKFIMGYVFAPIVWLMGVVAEDITLVGRLLGEKLIMTEFIAYVSLAELKSVGDAAFGSFVSEKSIIMSTYALCGFANFASIGIQIGGIGTLAPNKRKLISELGFRALLAGSLASLLSATIVGMILG